MIYLRDIPPVGEASSHRRIYAVKVNSSMLRPSRYKSDYFGGILSPCSIQCCAMNASSNLVNFLNWLCSRRSTLWCLQNLIINPSKPRTCLFRNSIISQILLEVTLEISAYFPFIMYQISCVVFRVVERV